ncbi:MAG: hypothetical protein EHM21_07080 [Chloroflexi bacterium]|nr:MAG: hypothetical protein EHM21_07080 [Chloroflexota bacterium]
MSEYTVPPSPGVVISEADQSQLPLIAFHLVVIVEADQESYMPVPNDLVNLGYILYEAYRSFEAEIDPDNTEAVNWEVPEDVEETAFVWLRNYDEDANYYKQFAETAYVKASFTLGDLDDTEHFLYYLRGLAAAHPDWRAAVIGAMFEDEVMQVANLIDEVGFSTTVLTRYCLSNQAFVNLDNLFAYDQWVRTSGRKEGEPVQSWLDEWMEDHHIGLDEEDEDEEDDVPGT